MRRGDGDRACQAQSMDGGRSAMLLLLLLFVSWIVACTNILFSGPTALIYEQESHCALSLPS